MKSKKILTFILTMALCVVMPTAVFAQEAPAAETPETSFTEEAVTEAPKLNVEVYRQDTFVTPVGPGITISIGSSIPEDMVEIVTDKVINSLVKSLKANGESIGDAQCSIRVEKPSPERVKQFVAMAEENEPKATKSNECVDWADHDFFEFVKCHDVKVSETGCEYRERRALLCTKCSYYLVGTDEVINVHYPSEMPGCPYYMGRKKPAE